MNEPRLTRGQVLRDSNSIRVTLIEGLMLDLRGRPRDYHLWHAAGGHRLGYAAIYVGRLPQQSPHRPVLLWCGSFPTIRARPDRSADNAAIEEFYDLGVGLHQSGGEFGRQMLAQDAVADPQRRSSRKSREAPRGHGSSRRGT